ncbi:MAG: hypothetical protein ABF380_12945 [Akkermansiaceae bacterium]
MTRRSLFLAGLLIQQSIAGTVVADFNDNTTGPLGVFNPGEGQGGGLGFLPGDVWANTGTIAVIASDLTSPTATNYSITQSGTPQSTQGTFTSGRHTTRAVDSPLTGIVWFSYLLNQPSLDSRGGITLNQDSSAPGNPRIVATGTEVRLGLGPTLQGEGGGANLLTVGETALILGRLTIDSTGVAETLDIWINPDVIGDASSLPAPDTTLSEETPSLDSGITRIGIQSYSADSQGGIIDSLRLSNEDNGFEVVTRDTVIILDDPNLAVSQLNPFADTIPTTGDAPITVDIQIENTGTNNTLTIADTTTITGEDATSYSVLTSLPFDLAPGASGTLQLQLDPSGEARNSMASLDLASNDSSTPTISIPLASRIYTADGSQLLNGDFEDAPSEPVNWITAGNTTLTEGIAPGSTFSAALAPLANLRQNILGESDWYLECFFQAPDTFDRAFNLFVVGPNGQINLRFQGTSAGSEQTWNLFDNATVSDSWGEAIALPAVQPGATYFIRIVGKAWDGIAPTYEIELSTPNSLAIASTVTGLNRYQGAIPTGAPSQIRFSAEFGNSPGYFLDDVNFTNGSPPPSGAPEILNIVHDPSTQTTTLTLATQVGVSYSVQGSDNLSNWDEIDDFIATGTSENFVEFGVTAPRRFYRFLIIE